MAKKKRSNGCPKEITVLRRRSGRYEIYNPVTRKVETRNFWDMAMKRGMRIAELTKTSKRCALRPKVSLVVVEQGR